jgi:hypothetical protein
MSTYYLFLKIKHFPHWENVFGRVVAMLLGDSDTKRRKRLFKNT